MNKLNIVFAGLLFFTLQVFSQTQSDPYSIEDSLIIDIDIFALNEPASITLKYDMKEFRKRQSEDKYLKAELIYHMSDSIEDITRTVRLKSRGKNRREVCNFPPIWINIRKSDIQNPTLTSTKKIKLVTHCGKSSSFETYVLKELLAYKIYNLISPYSFRVRQVRMRYIDTSRKNKVTERWAFLIEPEQMLAERLDMIALKNDKVSILQTDFYHTNIMSMYQMLIGNSDYSVAGRHNVKLLRDKDPLNSSVIPVPYDFDYTGLVNAHYAVPGDNLGIENVRERYFLGPCRTSQEFQEVINELSSERENIYELVNSFEYLPLAERKDITTYMEGFFSATGRPSYIERNLRSTCRK
jgi:hypothetical protein